MIFLYLFLLFLILLFIYFYYFKKHKNILKEELVIKHHPSAGFFSCCSIKLSNIVNYYNKFNFFPEKINTDSLFNIYKTSNKNIDSHFFQKNIENIDNFILNKVKEPGCSNISNYSLYDYKNLGYIINKYFKPTQKIINIKNKLISKYRINKNCTAVYYRGTDKYIEVKSVGFGIFKKKIDTIIQKGEKILLLTDSKQFLNYMENMYGKEKIIFINENKVSYKNRGIHCENTRVENYKDIFYLFASLLIISESKNIICTSGNCSKWLALYRGNCNNFYQYVNNEWTKTH